MEYKDKQDSWDFENFICVDRPELWVHEANNLKNSALVLNDFTDKRLKDLFDKKSPISNLPVFWSPRVERMLWGYAFENMFKGIIIVNLKNKDKIKEVPFSEIKSHDLIQLASKANMTLSDDEKFYIGICQKCSIWAGRYPIPTKKHGLPQSRKPMNSREELLERSRKQIQLLMEGKIKRIVTESDVMHSGVGAIELEKYTKIYDKALKMFNKN